MQIKLCYFNQHWNIYLYTDKGYDSWSRKHTTTVIPNETGEYRLRKFECSEAEIYSFGYMYNEANKEYRPGHNGEWSSNFGTINEVFGTNLYSVAIDQLSVAVPFEWLKELLGDRVVWTQDPVYKEWITQVKGVKNERNKWIEL